MGVLFTILFVVAILALLALVGGDDRNDRWPPQGWF